MVNGAALYAIVFDEVDNPLGLLYKNEDSKNVLCAIFDNFDCLVDIIHLHLAIKKNFSDTLRGHDLPNPVTRKEVPEVNHILIMSLRY